MIRILYSFIFMAVAAVALCAQNPPVTTPPRQPPTQPPTQQPNQPTQQPPAQQPGQPNTQPQPSQQRPPVTTTQPSQPGQQVPPGTTPAGQISNPNTVIQQSPTQNVGTTGGVAPAVLPDEPPPVAPNYSAPVRPLPDANRVGVDIANQLPMTLEEAITLALKNNNNIDISRNDVQVAEFNLRGARGVYDPLISGEAYYESATTPTASAIGGAVNGSVTQTRFFGTGGVNGFSPIGGGTYSADFNASRTSTSNTNSFLNPQFPSALTLTYTQPLLRNLRFDNNRRLIEIARKNLGLTDAQFRQQAIEVIAQVESSYWDLVFALRFLSVQIDAVKQARTQLESNQRLVEKGVLAPIDIVAATTQITTFEQSVYSAQESVTRAENNLKTLMLPERTSEVWTRAIVPVSEVSLETPKIGLEIALSEALKNRPEITQLQTNAEINRIDERYYRDQTKPQLDLVGQYTSQGLAGAPTARSINPTTGETNVPANLQGGFINSLGNLLGQDYPTYRVGVAISLPWGNTVAKANLGRTLVQANRIGNQRAQQEQVIEAEVRNSMQALKSGEARLASALASRQSAEELYESEQRRFRAGTTVFYLVLQRQTELLVARSRELQAQTDLNKAISEFQRATGTTLSANNVTVSQKLEFNYVPNRKNTAANSRFFSK
ncbi:MAG TPA: TolC family protein [Pyrinomonadaceae bacterium]|nr:TolC family protein [Pyrinomonadaceae bacterium]